MTVHNILQLYDRHRSSLGCMCQNHLVVKCFPLRALFCNLSFPLNASLDFFNINLDIINFVNIQIKVIQQLPKNNDLL